MKRLVYLIVMLFFSNTFLHSQRTSQNSIPSEPQPCTDPFSVSGTKEVVMVHSPGLVNNLLGDSPSRKVSIYLPPGYENSPMNRYPVIYFLHGYLGDHSTFFGGTNLPGLDFETILNKLFNSGAFPPAIVVSPSSFNKFEGSFYTNSSVTGQWEDFIVKDVVDYVESNYRTIPSRESRGIAGHSMGGYGTMKLAMLHPSEFSSAYMLSPYGLFLEDFVMDLFKNEVIEAACTQNPDDLPPDKWKVLSFIAEAAAFAPDTASAPVYGQLPLNCDGEVIDSVWQKWLLHDPYTMLSTFRDSLMKLNAIQFDCGIQDEHGFYGPCAKFSDTLYQIGIEHVFEGYNGDHQNRLAKRIETTLLPFFFENLEHEVPGIQRKSAWNLEPSDTLAVEIDLDGTVYIVPGNTPAVLDSIMENQVFSVAAVANSDVEIPLSGIEYGEYFVYGVNENNTGISLPVPFAVVPFIPDITIRVNDFSYGDPIEECTLDIDGTQYMTNPSGEVSITGCGANNSYSVKASCQNYTTIFTNMVAYTDTTFMVTLVKDSYLKVLDRATKEPVKSVSVRFGSSNLYTNDDGMITIHDLQSESLIFKAEHRDYFPLEDSVALRTGDTLVVELSKLFARVKFQVLDGSEPVSDQTIKLGASTGKTDPDGMAEFINKPARRVYHYSVERPCFFTVADSFFLESDTAILITLEPDNEPPEINVETSGDTHIFSSSVSGELYVVPSGTERLADSILANPYIFFPVTMNEPIYVNPADLPYGEFWVYIIDQCDNISMEHTLGVGSKEVQAESILIYPNPVNNILMIEACDYGRYNVDISSSDGRIIRKQKFTGTTLQIDLSSLMKGIYIISVRSETVGITRLIMKL